jgi:hypothetical protein
MHWVCFHYEFEHARGVGGPQTKLVPIRGVQPERSTRVLRHRGNRADRMQVSEQLDGHGAVSHRPLTDW